MTRKPTTEQLAKRLFRVGKGPIRKWIWAQPEERDEYRRIAAYSSRAVSAAVRRELRRLAQESEEASETNLERFERHQRCRQFKPQR